MSDEITNSDKRSVIGWREWVSLPDLGVKYIKAKIDTGARTSALHAFEAHEFQRDDVPWLAFSLHPRQRNDDTVLRCEAPLLDNRMVRDSGGHEENRFVITTQLGLGTEVFPIEMTLTVRDNMAFRMLLGRTAIAHRYTVDVGRSYLLGKRPRKKKKRPPET